MANIATPDPHIAPMLGESPAFLGLLDHVSSVAAINKSILVIGERGTGKELIAARLHYLSARWEKPFVKLNCAALTETLLETELFGHEAGAFTGASRRHAGRFEQADGGTLLLDELANAPLRVQEKILRTVEYGQFERVGGTDTLTVDVRVIGATNEDLPAAVRAGRFRADLLDRLAFDVLTVPPLRERATDILLLAEHFAVEMIQELGRAVFPGFTPQAREQLLEHLWPGNVRELKNAVERSLYRSAPDKPVHNVVLDPFASHFRPRLASTPAEDRAHPSVSLTAAPAATLPCDLKTEIATLEVALVQRALTEAQHQQKVAARLLGLSYHQLRALLRKHDLIPAHHRPEPTRRSHN